MFKFTAPTIPHHVFVIGAGGTGGRLMPMLTQFLRSITRGVAAQGWVESPTVWVIDDDIVEQKNLLRQNFIASDVGKPKAAVICERYSRAYGVNCVPILDRVTPERMSHIQNAVVNTLAMTKSINTSFAHVMDSAIVIICVDSVRARRDILNGFICINPDRNRTPMSRAARTFFIDSGNENTFGQVSFFTPHSLSNKDLYDSRIEAHKVPKMVPVEIDVDYVPMDVAYYMNLVDTPAQGSCADLNQTLSINAIMATSIMGIVQNYFYRNPMKFNQLNISLDGGNFTTFNTFNTFRNKALTAKEYTDYHSGRITASEVDGSKTEAGFMSKSSPIALQSIADAITSAIAEEERIRRVQQEKEENEARLKAAKEKGLAQLKERRKLRESQKVQLEDADEWDAPGRLIAVPENWMTSSIEELVQEASR